MATTLTPKLKLRVEDTLTRDAIHNLYRLDALGGAFIVTATGDLLIDSTGDIRLSPDGGEVLVDGSLEVTELLKLTDQASGGTRQLALQYDTTASGVVDNALDRIMTIDLEGADRLLVLGGDLHVGGDFSTVGGHALSLTTTDATSVTLPTSGTLATTVDVDTKEDLLGNPPADGYFLTSTASGTRNWIEPSAVVPAQNLSFQWVIADGLTKNFTHNFGTSTIEVSIYDETAGGYVTVNSISFPDDDNIQLTSLALPPTLGYQVFLREVQ